MMAFLTCKGVAQERPLVNKRVEVQGTSLQLMLTFLLALPLHRR